MANLYEKPRKLPEHVFTWNILHINTKKNRLNNNTEYTFDFPVCSCIMSTKDYRLHMILIILNMIGSFGVFHITNIRDFIYTFMLFCFFHLRNLPERYKFPFYAHRFWQQNVQIRSIIQYD